MCVCIFNLYGGLKAPGSFVIFLCTASRESISVTGAPPTLTYPHIGAGLVIAIDFVEGHRGIGYEIVIPHSRIMEDFEAEMGGPVHLMLEPLIPHGREGLLPRLCLIPVHFIHI